MGYLRSAVLFLQTTYNVSVPLFHNKGGTQKSDSLDPFLAELLAQRRIWNTKRPKRLALSGEILMSMHKFALRARQISDDQLESVLWDAVVLACYGGCRNSEYLQERVTPPDNVDWPKGLPYWERLPDSADLDPQWRGMPIALTRADFEFYDKRQQRLDHYSAVHSRDNVVQVHVRWRFDKSKENLLIRAFARLQGHPFCVVTACLSLVARSLRGMSEIHEPICMYRSTNGRRYCVRNKHMETFMHDACRDAHPDPNHYLRLHIKLLLPHSTRITAAVMLHNAGVPLDDIKFKLRWFSEAVREYIRECSRTISWLSAQAFQGAFMDSAH